jgi:hypothetical protein
VVPKQPSVNSKSSSTHRSARSTLLDSKRERMNAVSKHRKWLRSWSARRDFRPGKKKEKM